MINEFRGYYGFLSNFYPVQIEYEGQKFSSVEAAYQAAKTVWKEEREQFIGVTARKAKRLGRKVTLRPDWEEQKYQIMLNLIRLKFQNPYLKDKLLSTGNHVLIEGNYWHDNYWGSCFCEKCSMKYCGLNALGNILMEIRSELEIES